MFVTTAVLVGTLGVILWWALRPSRYHRLLAKIPGPRPVPIFGNTLQLDSDTTASFKQIIGFCDKYGHDSPVFKMMVGNLAFVMVYTASSAEKLLGSTRNLTKSGPYRFMWPWLQTGLLTSTGHKWQSRRKLLTPTFHFRILTDFLEIFNEQSEVLVSLLEEKCDKGPVDMFPMYAMCALDVICETAMGKKINAQKTGGNTEYVDAVVCITDLILTRFRSPWQWIDWIYNLTASGKKHAACLKTLHDFTKRVIAERIQEMETNPESFNLDPISEDLDIGINRKKRMAFLDLLIHMSKEADFSRNDIQEEVDTFMFEGHDTTTVGMSWATQLIGSHPDVQKKLHKEMDEIFGGSERPATMADISKMKYLECVLRESLRLYPSVPAVGRLIEEDTEIEGVQIPKGASLSVLIWKINRDPKCYEDPEKFDPDRFTPERSASRHPYAFVSFSAGPRNCIGQRFAMIEEKAVLSSILRKYNIESTQTIEEIKPIPELILRPLNGIKVKLTRRSAKAF